jgi:hypothetical protein
MHSETGSYDGEVSEVDFSPVMNFEPGESEAGSRSSLV